MEHSSYSELKDSLSSVPGKALNASSREILCRLDQMQLLTSPQDYASDYRGLAELMGFRHEEVKRIEVHKDCTMKILEAWETRNASTLDKLVGFLESMDRHDIIQDLIPSIERDAAVYKESLVEVSEEADVADTDETAIQADEEEDVADSVETAVQVDEGPTDISERFLTTDDLKNRECTTYDVALCYDDDDSAEAYELVRKLESFVPELKVFIHERDLLAGNFEFQTLNEIIMNRCRYVLLFLTPNFIRNPTLEFQVNVAAKLGIERRKRFLIPVVTKPCEIPFALKDMSKIDFIKKQKWAWQNLVSSILN